MMPMSIIRGPYKCPHYQKEQIEKMVSDKVIIDWIFNNSIHIHFRSK